MSLFLLAGGDPAWQPRAPNLTIRVRTFGPERMMPSWNYHKASTKNRRAAYRRKARP